MSTHVELSSEERKDVLSFWGDWFRSGGKGDEPSAFQVDALNDKLVRDTLFFWQVGGNPVNATESAQLHATKDWIEYLGARPDPASTMIGLAHVMGNRIEQGATPEDLDVSTVLILMHIQWMLVGGDFRGAAQRSMALASVTNLLITQSGAQPCHTDPLKAFANMALTLDTHERLGITPRETLLSCVTDMFCIPEDDEYLPKVRESIGQLTAQGGLSDWKF